MRHARPRSPEAVLAIVTRSGFPHAEVPFGRAKDFRRHVVRAPDYVSVLPARTALADSSVRSDARDG
jgi:hypothetical protein